MLDSSWGCCHRPNVGLGTVITVVIDVKGMGGEGTGTTDPGGSDVCDKFSTGAALDILRAVADLIPTTAEMLALYGEEGATALSTGDALRVLQIVAKVIPAPDCDCC
jgi:hypothetical protein